MELERRIVYDYTKYGDSPACLGDIVDVPQTAVLQGFGQQADGTSGELLELKLKTLTNEECYEEFKTLSQKPAYNRVVTQNTLFEGITDQILCTQTTCNRTDPDLKKLDKCDPTD